MEKEEEEEEEEEENITFIVKIMVFTTPAVFTQKLD
jgi:hypothetical protein